MRKKIQRSKQSQPLRRGRWYLVGGVILVGLLALGGWWARNRAQAPHDAPEASLVYNVQANMPFQILIPAYLPPEFDREKMEITVSQSGPGGEPMVQLAYPTAQGAVLFVREWVPVNPDMEILAASRPVETKWGKGWLLTQGDSLAALWVDIGPLRTSVYSSNVDILPRERILEIAETLGPVSSQQVFTFVVATPVIKEMAPPPPVEIPINDQGVQEFTLVVTPGGYDPLRFSVKAGVPVRMTFRQLGQVGCGNELIFPDNPQSPSSLRLANESDQQVLEFTPQQVGDFQFFCSHRMYRGVMTVRP
ncbi:MAG: cupredoxin domain-containing protein [Anaerolineales bacterium]